MVGAARIENLPGVPEVHPESPIPPPLSVHLKMEHKSPARQPENELPGCSTGAFNADGNMVGRSEVGILRGLLDAHIEPQVPSVPPHQPVIPQPMVVQRNTGGVYAFSRNVDNYFIISTLGELPIQEKYLTS